MTDHRPSGTAVIGRGWEVRQRLRRHSEARFRAVVDAAADCAILLLDPDGRITTWSPGAERINGYREDEVVGRHFSIFYPAEDRAAGKPQRALEFAAVRGRFTEDGWRLRKDGTRFQASVVITPIRAANGELLGFAKVSRDLTDRDREKDRVAAARAARDRAVTAARIHAIAITRLFEIGMDLQSLAITTGDVRVRGRLERLVAAVDETIRQLRAFVFHPEPPPRC